MSATTLTEANMRPGERLLNGERYVFNQDLLNLHMAREAVASAPADLSVLTDEEVRGLKYRSLRVSAAEGMVPGAGRALLRRCDAEYARRGWDSGGAPVAAASVGRAAA